MVVVSRAGTEGAFPWSKKDPTADIDLARLLPRYGNIGDLLTKVGTEDYQAQWRPLSRGFHQFADSSIALPANTPTTCTFNDSLEYISYGVEFLVRDGTQLRVTKTGMQIISVFVKDWATTDLGNRMIDLKLNGSTYARINENESRATASTFTTVGFFQESFDDYLEVDLRCGSATTADDIILRAFYFDMF
jgi:hypothetical protein